MRNLAHTLRLAAASLLVLTACAGAQAPASTPELWQKIQSANTDLSCDDSSQCHSIGVGSKACGGPENYIAWSSKNGDGAQLKALVEQHSAARRADDKRQGMMSTCSVVSDPGATCRAGICVINPRSVASPGQPGSK
ncbi:hypothetical protein FHW83_003817 [Duganella sp. SG902]|uniref:hypothetical protein n=1 Tax=Duganella sp. SG902 TaxID=2587016 RepID=UPI00159E93B7|nr:hypothetical protein [Duganella sp. SG902]NVM77993.1 hypothetical protein [Duganella sp. SG902]